MIALLVQLFDLLWMKNFKCLRRHGQWPKIYFSQIDFISVDAPISILRNFTNQKDINVSEVSTAFKFFYNVLWTTRWIKTAFYFFFHKDKNAFSFLLSLVLFNNFDTQFDDDECIQMDISRHEIEWLAFSSL